jgi:tetratricopeptide (TPR) repeat protein
MKLRILIFLISISGFSQTQITPYEQNMYDKATSRMAALDYLEIEDGLKNENPEVAKFALKIKQKVTKETFEIYQQLLDTLPNTKLLNRINYDIAGIHFRDGNTKLAIEYYLKVLDNPEAINSTSENQENFTRKEICITLAELYIQDKEYTTALKYLDESKNYKVQYGCGNAAIDDYNRLKQLYALCQNTSEKK